jgi:hypothetical protein
MLRHQWLRECQASGQSMPQTAAGAMAGATWRYRLAKIDDSASQAHQDTSATAGTIAGVLQLQRTVGNRAVEALLAGDLRTAGAGRAGRLGTVALQRQKEPKRIGPARSIPGGLEKRGERRKTGDVERGYFEVTDKVKYGVRAAGPARPEGLWFDHLFDTQAEAEAYARQLAAKGEAGIRGPSGLPVTWPPEPPGGAPVPGNPVVNVYVHEIPAGTPTISGVVGPQPEGSTWPGLPRSYPGGGPQTVISGDAKTKVVGPPIRVAGQITPPSHQLPPASSSSPTTPGAAGPISTRTGPGGSLGIVAGLKGAWSSLVEKARHGWSMLREALAKAGSAGGPSPAGGRSTRPAKVTTKYVDVDIDLPAERVKRARLKQGLGLAGKGLVGAAHGLEVWGALSTLGEVTGKLDALSHGGVSSATRKVMTAIDDAFPTVRQVVGPLSANEFKASATYLVDVAGEYIGAAGGLSVPPEQAADEEEIIARIGWHVATVDRYQRAYTELEQIVLDYYRALVPLVEAIARHCELIAAVRREVWDLWKAYASVPFVNEQLGYMYLAVWDAANMYGAIATHAHERLHSYDSFLEEAGDVLAEAEELAADWIPRWEASGRRSVGTN